MLLGYTAPTGYMFARLLRFPSLKINPENAYQSYYQSSAPEKSNTVVDSAGRVVRVTARCGGAHTHNVECRVSPFLND